LSEINRALGFEGEPLQMPVNGTVYKLSPPTQALMGAFEEYLEAGLRGRIYALEGKVSSEAFAEAVLRFGEKAEAGEYAFTSAYATRVMSTHKGRVHFFWLFLREHQPRLTEADAEKLIREHPQAVGAALTELNGALRKKLEAPAAAS
jgi:hypothetical protein